MENVLTRPPVGLKPKFIKDSERLREIKSAMQRYIDAGCKVPLDWVVEYNELIDAKK